MDVWNVVHRDIALVNFIGVVQCGALLGPK